MLLRNTIPRLVRLFQPIPTFLALVPQTKQSCKRPCGDLSMYICRHLKKLLVGLAENINSAMQLSGIGNAGCLYLLDGCCPQRVKQQEHSVQCTLSSLPLLLGKIVKFLLRSKIMFWVSKEDGRSPELTLSNATKALHTSQPVFLADD